MIKPLGADPSFRSFGLSCGKETIAIETSPNDSQTITQNAFRRAQEITWRIAVFIGNNYDPEDEILLVLEAPSLNGARANHLFEMGILFSDLYGRLPGIIQGRKISIVEIPPGTLKKWATGNGGPDKNKLRMKSFVKERWGVEFELDKGGDKTDAFALYKLGVAILEGEYEFHAAPRRGKGKGVKRAKSSKNTTRGRKKSSQDQSDKPAGRGKRTVKASRRTKPVPADG